MIRKAIDFILRDVTNLAGICGYLFYCSIIFFYNLNEFFRLILLVIFSTIIIVLIRSLIFRDRPRAQKHTNYFEKIDASSFPSFHSTRAMIISCSIYFLFKNRLSILFAICFFIVIAYSRYYLKKHYITDIVVGGLLGFCLYILTLIIL